MTKTINDAELIKKIAANIKETLSPGAIAQLVRLIEPTGNTGEMSSEEFEQFLKEMEAKNSRRGFSEKSVEAARLVLVNGATIAEAAAETNQSRQSVNQLMIRLRHRMQSVPEGWVLVRDWFPPEVAVQLSEITESLKASYVAGKPLDAKSLSISFKE